MDLRIVIACLILGAITEALSYWFRLWIYHASWLRLVSVLLVYGGIFGWLSTVVASWPVGWRFASGAVAGVIYEGSNLLFLHWWHFPNQRLAFLRGPVALTLGAGIPWGLAPMLTPLFSAGH